MPADLTPITRTVHLPGGLTLVIMAHPVWLITLNPEDEDNPLLNGCDRRDWTLTLDPAERDLQMSLIVAAYQHALTHISNTGDQIS